MRLHPFFIFMRASSFVIVNFFMSAYKKIHIYYFSGTGNSKNVANWLSQIAKENQISVCTTNISQIERRNITEPEENVLLIFISPIHGFNYPPIMLNFIWHFPRGKNKIILMNTRAGMLLHKWVTPGLSGITFYFSSLVLLLKGYRIKGLFPVDLPSNWISLHPGLNNKTITFIHRKMKVKINNFANRVFSGKSDFRSCKEIIQDVLVSPISVLYYFIGRFFLAKTFYASSKCDNCNSCINNCPVKAIIKMDNRPFWTYKCESCMKCMGNCPKKAIETAHGFSFGIWFIYTLVILELYNYGFTIFSKALNSPFSLVIKSIIFLILMYSGYFLMHYLLRYKLFEKLVVYSSLTRYKFWGRRYKAIRL